MDTAELSRRLENLIRPGTIVEVDHALALVRVQTGNLTTDWLPWFERRAGDTRTWSPPTVGEQAMILSPSGEPAAGFVLVGLYSTAHQAPADAAAEHVIQWPNGARIEYDHTSSTLTISGIDKIIIDGGDIVHNGGSLSSHGIVLHTHVHGGVSPGPDNTGAPKQ